MNPIVKTIRGFAVPLFWYLTVTLIVPLLNTVRQGFHAGFWEHAAWVAGVPMIIIGTICIIKCAWLFAVYKYRAKFCDR